MGWFRRRGAPQAPLDEELKPLSFDSVPPRSTTPRTADWSTSGLISINPDGTLSVTVSSVPEAKLAIKDLRLRKRQLSAERKAVNQQMAAMRAERRLQLARQGSMIRGGGDFGKTIRAFDRLGRDISKRQFAQSLVPYENEKQRLTVAIAEVDSIIHQLDAFILKETERARSIVVNVERNSSTNHEEEDISVDEDDDEDDSV